MSYCSVCGNPYKEGVKFCTACGKPLFKEMPAGHPILVSNIQNPAATTYTDSQKSAAQNSGLNIPLTTIQKSKKTVWVILAVLVIAGAAITSYFLFFTKKENNRLLYVLADNLKLRSSQYDNSDANIVSTAVYGNPVKIIKEEGEWVKVNFNNQEGYMRFRYLATDRDFFEADAIIHSIGTADTIKETRFKRSLLDYFRQHNYKPPFPQVTDFIKTTYLSDTSSYKNKEEWRILQSSVIDKTYIKGKFTNSSKQGMAVILEQSNNGVTDRKLLVFNYDDNEIALPVAAFSGKFLWVININKSDPNTWYINSIYQPLSFNSILAFNGEERYVFMFDGAKMDGYLQPPEFVGD